jgi:hypothetical protein
MKIYFGQVSQDDVDAFGEDGLIGPDSNGNFYGQYVEYGTNPGGLDEIVIADGCNRMVPITIESLTDLIVALQDIQEANAKIAQAKKLKKHMKSDGIKYVEDEEVFWDIEVDYQQSFKGTGW